MILEATAITKEFKVKNKEHFKALDRVSFYLKENEVLGIVGESGSGKSTLADIAGGLLSPTEGSVYFLGRDISKMKGEEKKEFRRSVQFIFQSPKESMNPYFTIKRILTEPLSINYKKMSEDEKMNRIKDILSRVGIDSETALSLYPSSFSGGQLQRIAIARALLLEPEVIISDECTSSLDVSLQAQILNLLLSLKKEYGTSLIFISHDISLVRYVSDRIIVMKDGKIVEDGDVDKVIEKPEKDYTKELIKASLMEGIGEA